jgi:hypothetical protein
MADSQGLTFSPEGRRMYVLGNTTDSIYQYELSYPFDIRSASFGEKLLSVGADDTFPTGLSLQSDGNAIFVIGALTKKVFRYGLTTPWNISSGTVSDKSFSIATENNFPTGIRFSANGLRFCITGTQPAGIFEYACTKKYDLTTAYYTGVSFNLQPYDEQPQGLYFTGRNPEKFFIVGGQNHSVYEFNASGNTVANAEFSAAKEITNQTYLPQSIFFNTSGYEYYVVGNASIVHAFSVEKAFDISTTQYKDIFTSVALEEDKSLATITSEALQSKQQIRVEDPELTNTVIDIDLVDENYAIPGRPVNQVDLGEDYTLIINGNESYQLTSETLLHPQGYKYTYVIESTVNPTVTDDGYITGTHWINTVTNTAFVLLDNNTGTALWQEIGAASAVENTVDPTTTDDDYPLGTVWINTAADTAFILIDNTPSAALWQGIGDASSGGSAGILSATVDLTSAGTQNLSLLLPANSNVIRTSLDINTLSDAATTVTIGDDTNGLSSYMSDTENDPEEQSLFIVDRIVYNGGSDVDIKAVVATPGTVGTATVFVQYQ